MAALRFGDEGSTEFHVAELVDEVQRRLLESPEEISTRLLANTVWAVAKLVLIHQPLLDTIESTLEVAECSPQSLANIAWAFAALLVYNGPLFEMLSRQVIVTTKHFNAQNVSNTAWAFAVLRMPD